jgi:hypothetical protein
MRHVEHVGIQADACGLLRQRQRGCGVGGDRGRELAVVCLPQTGAASGVPDGADHAAAGAECRQNVEAGALVAVGLEEDGPLAAAVEQRQAGDRGRV